MTFRELRGEKSLEEIAKGLGVKPKTIAKYECSVRTPSASILALMPKVYNCNANLVLEAYEYHKKEAIEKHGKINP